MLINAFIFRKENSKIMIIFMQNILNMKKLLN